MAFKNKTWAFCFLFCLIALLAMTIFLGFFYLYPANPAEELWLTIRRDRFIDYNGHNDVRIYFPQFFGLGDKERSEAVNDLIEADAKKNMQNNESYAAEKLDLQVDYEHIFVNENLISIFYKSSYRTSGSDRGYSRSVIGTTIDIETVKVVALSTLLIDLDALYDLLMEDKFEGITAWDGVKGGYHISDFYYSWVLRENLKDALNSDGYDPSQPRVEWYIDGENFVVVTFESRYYYEYSIKIEEIKDIINPEFIEKLGIS